LSLPRGGGVIDAKPFEILAPLGVEPAVLRARGDDDALGPQSRVAALDLEAGWMLAAGEGERQRLRPGVENFAPNDRPEAERRK